MINAAIQTYVAFNLAIFRNGFWQSLRVSKCGRIGHFELPNTTSSDGRTFFIHHVILGIDQSFTNNTSWRFFDANQNFSNPSNPWADELVEIVSINDIVGEVTVDFNAIKVGDVNGSAKANEFSSLDERSRGSFAFNVEDVNMVAGNTYNVEFTAADIATIEGYQGTFTLGASIEIK